MKLKMVALANFKYSEATNFQRLDDKYDLDLRPGEVLCMVSMSGDQIVFVHRPSAARYETRDGAEPVRVLHSQRLRLPTGAKWNPMMLANYARSQGIALDGLKLFEEHYKAA